MSKTETEPAERKESIKNNAATQGKLSDDELDQMYGGQSDGKRDEYIKMKKKRHEAIQKVLDILKPNEP